MCPEMITGSSHSDDRGNLDFFNDFDLSTVVRFYKIIPSDTAKVRAWQGHKFEAKWFYCLRGSFVVNLIPLSKFMQDDPPISAEIYTLHGNEPKILRIPAGYVNGFRACKPGSELLVFSDTSIEESIKDDYRFNLVDRDFLEPN